MFFWHKRSTIILDCFTYIESVALNHPIARAGKFYPEDLRDVPKTISKKIIASPRSKLLTEFPTIKECNGLTDLYRNGFILPAWDSFDIEMLGENDFLVNNRSKLVTGEHHSRTQYNDKIFRNSCNIKLVSPWFIREKTGVKFVWMHPMWNRSDNVENISIVPAVVDFQKKQSTNINGFMRKNSIVSYNAGDPLVHMIPISDKKIKINIHSMSPNDWEREKTQLNFHKSMANHRELIFPNIFQPKKKCPFGF
jgi:hypothetical protein